MKSLLLLSSIIFSLFFISSCSPLASGAAVIAQEVTDTSNDRRSAGELIDDKNIYKQLVSIVKNDPMFESSHIRFLVYDKSVVILGEAPSEKISDHLNKKIKLNITSIKQIINEIKITKNISYLSRTKDGLISAQINALFLNQEVFHPNHILLKTNNQTVYLMGAVTQREAEHATNVVSKAKNVMEVVKLFNIIAVRPAAEIERDNKRFEKEKKIAELEQKKLQLEQEQNKVLLQLDDLIYE
jgi:osmotically-inducible protein OsmY